MLAFMSDTGIIVVVIAFVALFGASQIPKLARNIAEAGKEFRKVHGEAENVPVLKPELDVPASQPVASDRVTLTKGELQTLLSDRETAARNQS